LDFRLDENKVIMRSKTKILAVLLGFSILFSCNEWMELIPPQGLIREEFWKTKEDVEAVVMGAYESFSRMDRELFLFGELRGDMLEGDYNQGLDEQKIQESNIYSDNYLCNWAKFYQVINYCNEIIKNVPLVDSIDNTYLDIHWQGHLSEAYFMRSMAYFYLVRIYKDVPFITEPTESDDSEFYVEKNDGDDILRILITELEEYRKFATVDGFKTPAEIKGRATKAAYDGLLADINLWLFEYDEVIRHVQNIESNIKYVLMPGAKWFEMFYPGNSLESIFEFQYNTERSQQNNLYGLTNYDGHNYDPSPSAQEMFAKEYTSELVRGEGITIRKEGEGDYIIWKYVGRSPDGETARPSSEQTSANFIIYRLADVLLMKAEALSQLGRYNEALDIINEIRERAGIAPVTVNESPAAFEDAILHERALELAYEGKRWFDLLRLGRRNDFARKSVLIATIVKNVPSTQKRILATKLTNPLGWFMPIYDLEIERNRNLVQNPYYNY